MTRLRVALVGCGLIGGSVGLALDGNDEFEVVAAFDPYPGRAAATVSRGAALRAVDTIAEAAAGADVIVIAAPVSQIAALAAEASEAAPDGAVVTDVGSVKAPIVAAAEAKLRRGVHFVGGHPMAGSEREGIEAADADLFRNATWVVTPTAATDPDALRTVHRLVTACGAAAMTLDPATHDAAVATISHLPQVAASSLMNVAAARGEAAPPLLRLAAGGFRDVTRIAAGSSRVWEDILTENAPAVREVLDAYLAELTAVRDALDDRARLHDRLATARAARHALPNRGLAGDLHEVVVAIPDRPGAFAEVTAALGEAGVNIVDIELRHSPEGGGGVLSLVVAGAGRAATAVDALRARGHHTYREAIDDGEADVTVVDVLAIDGPGGAGKSTVSRRVAEHLGIHKLDTGAIYRSVTAAVLRAGEDPADAAACTAIAESALVRFVDDRVLLGDLDVTAEIRGPEVTAAVSLVSAHPGVRSCLVAQQRRIAAAGGAWVVEGRDIGTVVFPNARLKVYLTASALERARRRAAELGETDLGSVESDIERRDRLDSTRAESPLRPAEDAVTVDTTDLGIDAVVARIAGLWSDTWATARTPTSGIGDATAPSDRP